MPFPSWLAYGFAVLMVAVSAYCVGRLALARRMGRRIHRGVNVAHVLMGFAMAGMLVPSWRIVPIGAWEVVFAGVGTYFLIMCGRFVAQRGVAGVDDDHGHHVSHFAIHMVMAGAMLYMLWLTTSTVAGLGSASMSMTGSRHGVGDPGLTLTFVVVLVASAVWQLDAMGRFAIQGRQVLATVPSGDTVRPVHVTAAVRPWLAPRLEICCHVAMCLAMGYMLVLSV